MEGLFSQVTILEIAINFDVPLIQQRTFNTASYHIQCDFGLPLHKQSYYQHQVLPKGQMLAISQKGFMIQQKLGPIAQLIEKKRVVPLFFNTTRVGIESNDNSLE